MEMKNKVLSVLVLTIFVLSMTSCTKNKEITCNLNTGEQAPMDLPIVFTASQTGDGVITSLYYKAGDTEETIVNPYLPWTLNIDVSEGDQVLITATGTVKDGTLEVTYEGESGGFKMSGSDNCSNSNN